MVTPSKREKVALNKLYKQAITDLLKSPAMEDIDFSKARGFLVNITAGLDMRLDESEEIKGTSVNLL
ncbi:hypothetical protein [Vibrio sp. MA40-2]|uniref:hypothetical protein n=1 Tax=Vibrio sp. MA40-2 TaxID=3391828 RepID=UPI0039A418A5